MNISRNEQIQTFLVYVLKKFEFFTLKPVVIVIPQHILAESHYFIVHGPDHLS